MGEVGPGGNFPFGFGADATFGGAKFEYIDWVNANKEKSGGGTRFAYFG